MKKRAVKQELEEGAALFTIRLPESLHRKVRIKALQEGTSMQSIAQKAFADFVKAKKP